MNRRKLLPTLDVAATGTSAAFGSGAFTSVSADRTVTVSVAGDEQAYPRLEPTSGPNGDYARTENGQLAVHLNRENDDASKDSIGGASATTVASPQRTTLTHAARMEAAYRRMGTDLCEAYRNIRSQTTCSTDSSAST
jgi:hypothetical protein